MNHNLAVQRGQRWDQLVARLARDEHPATLDPALDHLADRGAPGLLRRRAIAEVRHVRFQRVNHGDPRGSRGVEHRFGRGDRRAKGRDVVAEARAEPAFVAKVPLPVHHDQRALARVPFKRERRRGLNLAGGVRRLFPGSHRQLAKPRRARHGRHRVERGTHRVARSGGSEHPALHVHHLDRRRVVPRVGGAGAVFEQEALVPAVVSLAHRGVDADVGGDAAEDDTLDPTRAEDQVQVRRAERTFPWLVHHVLPRERVELGDEIPAGFAPDEDLAARPGIPDAGARLPRPPPLVIWEAREGRAVALAGVDDPHAGGAGGGEASAQRFDGRPGQRHVVAHLCDVAAEAAEVGLHVDEHEGDVIGVE